MHAGSAGTVSHFFFINVTVLVRLVQLTFNHACNPSVDQVVTIHDMLDVQVCSYSSSLLVDLHFCTVLFI